MTVLGTLEPLLAALHDRRAALAWRDRWLPLLAAVSRCDPGSKDITVCPSCRRSESCPVDVWHRYLAAAALGTPTTGPIKSSLHTTGANTGTGVLTTWLVARRRLLAEATAWLV